MTIQFKPKPALEVAYDTCAKRNNKDCEEMMRQYDIEFAKQGEL